MATELWQVGLIVFSTFFVGFAPIFLKRGLNLVKGFDLKGLIFNPNFIFGFFLYGCGYVISMPALKYGEISILYPFVSLAYVWVALFSNLLLHEEMNSSQWIGIVCIMIGVSCIGAGIV